MTLPLNWMRLSLKVPKLLTFMNSSNKSVHLIPWNAAQSNLSHYILIICSKSFRMKWSSTSNDKHWRNSKTSRRVTSSLGSRTSFSKTGSISTSHTPIPLRSKPINWLKNATFPISRYLYMKIRFKYGSSMLEVELQTRHTKRKSSKT